MFSKLLVLFEVGMEVLFLILLRFLVISFARLKTWPMLATLNLVVKRWR